MNPHATLGPAPSSADSEPSPAANFAREAELPSQADHLPAPSPKVSRRRYVHHEQIATPRNAEPTIPTHRAQV